MKDVYIKITNSGEIDVNAFKLIGASSKREDSSKIGFFGSGLKYALAVLLKNKIKLKVFSGLTEIKLGTKTEEFRNEKFDIITVNGCKTSLTTDMGPSWKLWFAIREIYCNALDETNGTIGVCNLKEIEPTKNQTLFCIQLTDELNDFLKNWNTYFSIKRTDLVESFKGAQLYQSSESLIIYRKGVQCYTNTEKALYDYNLDWVDINESRVIENMYQVYKMLPLGLAKHASVEVAKNILENHTEMFEEELYWEYVKSIHGSKFNENWFKAIDDKVLVNRDLGGYFKDELDLKKSLFLNSRLIKALSDTFEDRIVVYGVLGRGNEAILKTLDTTPREKQLIDDSINFLKKASLDIIYQVKVCKFKSDTIYGSAENNTIYLSRDVFNKGRKQIVEVMYEEYLHLKEGFDDKSRRFQSYLIEQLITNFEKEQDITL